MLKTYDRRLQFTVFEAIHFGGILLKSYELNFFLNLMSLNLKSIGLMSPVCNTVKIWYHILNLNFCAHLARLLFCF